MTLGIYSVPKAKNEKVLNYAPGSREKSQLKSVLSEMGSKPIDVPMYIGGMEVRGDEQYEIRAPHNIDHLLGHYYLGTEKHVNLAIDAALAVRPKWQSLNWDQRASIFFKGSRTCKRAFQGKN